MITKEEIKYIYDTIVNELGIPNPPKLVRVSFFGSQYSLLRNTIMLNYSSSYDIRSVLAHELYHAYQMQVLNIFSLDEEGVYYKETSCNNWPGKERPWEIAAVIYENHWNTRLGLPLRKEYD